MTTLLISQPQGLEHHTPQGHAERPERLAAVEDALSRPKFRKLERREAHSVDLAIAELVHGKSYLEKLRRARPMEGIAMIDGDTYISDGSFDAAASAVGAALQALDAVVLGEADNAFCAIRPPGHHAAIDMFGGYCFLNNAAVAAQHMLDQGLKRVAIVDVDFHHGNGTQDIFYTRNDVLFASLHGDPVDAFPHFLGYADETGSGDGEGFNFNYPMKPGTGFSQWRKALGVAFGEVQKFEPEALIISLGVDTFENDPISFFKLKSADFITYGTDIANLNLPTLFIMEGGYDIDEIGINTINVLQGFDAASGTL